MAIEESEGPQRALDAFPRLSRLHAELLSADRGICVERARYVTEAMKGPNVWFDPPVVRRAKVAAHILRHLQPKIYPDENNTKPGKQRKVIQC